MMAKPVVESPENLLESIDTFFNMVNRAMQTEYPGMSLRTAATLAKHLEKASDALGTARRVLDNVITSR